MTSYRNPHAALRVGQMIETHLTKSRMSYQELALRIGVSNTKIVSFVTGRNYFPVEFVNPTADALGIGRGDLIYSALHQYFPATEVDVIWEAIATYIVAQQEPAEEGANVKRSEKQKKKKKKSR